MFFQLVDVHRFGDWRIFLDGEETSDPSLNSVSVEMTLGKEIREAAKTLRPVNVTDGTK